MHYVSFSTHCHRSFFSSLILWWKVGKLPAPDRKCNEALSYVGELDLWHYWECVSSIRRIALCIYIAINKLLWMFLDMIVVLKQCILNKWLFQKNQFPLNYFLYLFGCKPVCLYFSEILCIYHNNRIINTLYVLVHNMKRLRDILTSQCIQPHLYDMP